MTILADTKALLGITDTTHDLQLGQMIAGIMDEADEYMGVRCSEAESVEDWFDGGTPILYLRHVNILSFHLYEDGVLQAADTYALYSADGKVKKVCGDWQSGFRVIRVIYDGGYEEDALPASLRTKLIKQISYEFRRRKDIGLASVTYPDGTINKFAMDEWLPDVKAELDRRRRLIL